MASDLCFDEPVIVPSCSTVCAYESDPPKWRPRAFTCWRTEHVAERGRDVVLGRSYVWSEAAKQQTTYHDRVLAESQYILGEIAVQRCGGNGRCFIELPQKNPIPVDAPFESFLRRPWTDLFRPSCQCVLQKCRNFVVCGKRAPEWYLDENEDACPECVDMKRLFIEDVKPCSMPANAAAVAVDDRRVCIAEPYFYEFDSRRQYQETPLKCHMCDVSCMKQESVTFSNCYHRLCYDCAKDEEGSIPSFRGRIVCGLCVLYFFATCKCGLFEDCHGGCYRAFMSSIAARLCFDECDHVCDDTTCSIRKDNNAQVNLCRATMQALIQVKGSELAVEETDPRLVLRNAASDELNEWVRYLAPSDKPRGADNRCIQTCLVASAKKKEDEMADSRQEVSQGQRAAGAFRNVFVADAKNIEPKQCIELSRKAGERIKYAVHVASEAVNTHPFIANATKLDVTSKEAKDAASDFLREFQGILTQCLRISMTARYGVLIVRSSLQVQHVDVTADIPDTLSQEIPSAIKVYDDLYGRLMHFYTQACIIVGDMHSVAHQVGELLRSMGDVTVSIHQMYEADMRARTNVFHMENLVDVCEKIMCLYEAHASQPDSTKPPPGNPMRISRGGWRMTLLALISSQVTSYIQRYVSYAHDMDDDPNRMERPFLSDINADPCPLSRLLDLESQLSLLNYQATATFNFGFTRLEGVISREEAKDGVFGDLVDASNGRFVLAAFPSNA